MSEYVVTATLNGKELTKLSPFYAEGRANLEAQRESRRYSSPDVLVIVTCSDRKRGYPKCYRMGRTFRPS